jgi:hypothetical protein
MLLVDNNWMVRVSQTCFEGDFSMPERSTATGQVVFGLISGVLVLEEFNRLAV